MFINEYGDKNNPLFLLLAPMMVSGEDMYQLMHPYFKHDYHYITPDQDGHGKAGAYISADEEYKTLKSFLLDKGYREIEMVYLEESECFGIMWPVYMTYSSMSLTGRLIKS